MFARNLVILKVIVSQESSANVELTEDIRGCYTGIGGLTQHSSEQNHIFFSFVWQGND